MKTFSDTEEFRGSQYEFISELNLDRKFNSIPGEGNLPERSCWVKGKRERQSLRQDSEEKKNCDRCTFSKINILRTIFRFVPVEVLFGWCVLVLEFLKCHNLLNSQVYSRSTLTADLPSKRILYFLIRFLPRIKEKFYLVNIRRAGTMWRNSNIR